MKTCACGKSFEPTGRNSKYCSKTCRTDFYKKSGKSKEWRDAFNAKNGVQVGIGSGGNTGSWEQNHMYSHGRYAFRNFARKLKDAGVPCNRCGIDLTHATRGNWCGHHKDHNPTNNSTDNLELLCKRCHQIEHESINSLRKVQRLSPCGSTHDQCGSAEHPENG